VHGEEVSPSQGIGLGMGLCLLPRKFLVGLFLISLNHHQGFCPCKPRVSLNCIEFIVIWIELLLYFFSDVRLQGLVWRIDTLLIFISPEKMFTIK